VSEAFSLPVRVYWEDTDGGGVVYYANYLKYMERARTELLRSRGWEQSHLQANDGLVFAVVSATVDYRAPARLDDLLAVTAELVARRRVSLDFDQTVSRKAAGGEVLCAGRFRVACLDAQSFRPRPIPAVILEEFR
jgi:acyl-CoA thioester hydrolase